MHEAARVQKQGPRRMFTFSRNPPAKPREMIAFNVGSEETVVLAPIGTRRLASTACRSAEAADDNAMVLAGPNYAIEAAAGPPELKWWCVVQAGCGWEVWGRKLAWMLAWTGSSLRRAKLHAGAALLCDRRRT
eukprot:365920-Chlamydomonas_euryale.AAC.11